jgi:hypothetical protein
MSTSIEALAEARAEPTGLLATRVSGHAPVTLVRGLEATRRDLRFRAWSCEKPVRVFNATEEHGPQLRWPIFPPRDKPSQLLAARSWIAFLSVALRVVRR